MWCLLAVLLSLCLKLSVGSEIILNIAKYENGLHYCRRTDYEISEYKNVNVVVESDLNILELLFNASCTVNGTDYNIATGLFKRHGKFKLPANDTSIIDSQWNCKLLKGEPSTGRSENEFVLSQPTDCIFYVNFKGERINPNGTLVAALISTFLIVVLVCAIFWIVRKRRTIRSIRSCNEQQKNVVYAELYFQAPSQPVPGIERSPYATIIGVMLPNATSPA